MCCWLCRRDYPIKIISVGFVLLVQLYRAMRRPQDVERVTKYGSPRFFFNIAKTLIFKELKQGGQKALNSRVKLNISI